MGGFARGTYVSDAYRFFYTVFCLFAVFTDQSVVLILLLFFLVVFATCCFVVFCILSFVLCNLLLLGDRYCTKAELCVFVVLFSFDLLAFFGLIQVLYVRILAGVYNEFVCAHVTELLPIFPLSSFPPLIWVFQPFKHGMCILAYLC